MVAWVEQAAPVSRTTDPNVRMPAEPALHLRQGSAPEGSRQLVGSMLATRARPALPETLGACRAQCVLVIVNGLRCRSLSGNRA